MPAMSSSLSPGPAGADTLPLLAECLHRRRAVHLLYDGAWRVVHPHAIGRTARGMFALLGWQTAGFGRSGVPEGWRLFKISRIAAAEALQAGFAPRPRPATGRWTAGLGTEIAAI